MRFAALALVLLPLAASSGPPTMCFPIDIGGAVSLPFGEGPFEKDPDYDRGELGRDVFEILGESDDFLVHMETLRRAVVYCDGPGKERTKEDGHMAEALLAELEHEQKRFTKENEGLPDEERNPRAEALKRFDVLYTRVALVEFGFAKERPAAREFDELRELVPADPAFELGAALAFLGSPKDREGWRSLGRLLELPRREDGLALDNALSIVGQMHDIQDLDGLAERVARELAR